MRAHRIHGVQMVGGIFRALSAGQEYDPGDRRRHVAGQATHRGLGHLLHAGLTRALLAGDHHVRLEQHALEQHAVGVQFGEHRLQHLGRYRFAAFDAVGTVHKHFRLHDRHEVHLLAERGVTRQPVGIGANAERGRNIVLVDLDHRAPLRELCSKLFVLGETFAQAVQPLGDFVAGIQRQRLGAFVHLDPGGDPPARQQPGKGSAVAGALAQGFVEENDAADIALDTVGGKKYFAVAPAVFFGGLGLDRIETLLDRGTAFVRRQHALLFRDDGACHGFEFVDVHWLYPPVRTISRVISEVDDPSAVAWNTRWRVYAAWIVVRLDLRARLE